MRTLDDIRALGGNDAADERRFATAARISEVNLALYRTFAQPAVRALVSGPVAEMLQHMHPLKVQYENFSNANPFMAPVAAMAEEVRKNRKPIASDTPFVAMQETVSKQIVAALDGWRDFTEAVAERTFLTVYGSPALQAAAGIDPADTRPLRKPAKNPLHNELLQKRIAELKSQIPTGGLREAIVRALIYVGLERGSVDERGFETIRRLRNRYGNMPLSEFKALARKQFAMLLIDQQGALAALPSLLPPDAESRSEAFDVVKQVLEACGETSAEDEKRLSEIGRLFGIAEEGATIPFLQIRRFQAKAS
jgi:Protein of unknown function (DUF3141)